MAVREAGTALGLEKWNRQNQHTSRHLVFEMVYIEHILNAGLNVHAHGLYKAINTLCLPSYA